MTQKQKFLFIGIVLLTFFFRFFLIHIIPGGLFPDEAANGLDINMMQQGQLQPFYERGNGREALFFYMLWGSVEIFDKGHWQHHIISALVGALATIFTFFLTRRLIGLTEESDGQNERATNIALWAMFFMAISSWHVTLSRTAFRANLIPLFTTATFFFLIWAVQAKTLITRYITAIFTGIAFALGFYTYIAYRILAPLLAILFVWPIAVDVFIKPRLEQIKKFYKPAILASIAFVIVIAPLAHYFYTHPGSFVGRSGQVSVFNPELNNGDLIGTIGQVSWLSLKAYFTDGDLNWRHNVSGQPFLPIMISPFFALGMILSIFWAILYAIKPHPHKNNWPYFLLVGWFWSMLIPVVTTAEGMPHGLRAIGTIPPVFIFSAIGLWWLTEKIQLLTEKYWPLLPTWKQTFILGAKYTMIGGFVIAMILQTYILYFIYSANSPEQAYAFRSDLTTVSNYLKEFGNKQNTYLILDKFSVQTVDYFTTFNAKHPDHPHNQPYIQVDPEDAWKLNNLKSGDQFIFTQSSIFDIKKFKTYHPQAKLVREDRNQFQQTVMAVYKID